MRVVLEGEQRIRVQAAAGEPEIQSATPGIHFSPLHMLAASLATCTLSVLANWAMQAALRMDDVEIVLDWEYVDAPYRVGRYAMTVRWPSLPEARWPAALRVAEHCTVEHTLTHPPTIEMRITT